MQTITIRGVTYGVKLPDVITRRQLVDATRKAVASLEADPYPSARVCAAVLAACIPELAAAVKLDRARLLRDVYGAGNETLVALDARGWTLDDVFSSIFGREVDGANVGGELWAALLAQAYPTREEVVSAGKP